MAHQTPVAAWLYSNKQIFDLRFREFDWTTRHLPGVHDFSAVVGWNGVEAEGRGLANSSELALEKASAEAIERLICRLLNLDSVGMAVSGTLDPTIHARNEVYERYFLNSHLNLSIPMPEVKKPSGASSHVVELFRSHNPKADLQFFKFATPTDFHGAACLIDSQQKSLGFAFGTSLDDVISRSFLETLPNFAWFQDQQDKLVDQEKDQPSPNLPWHLREDFLNSVIPLLGGSGDGQMSIALPQVVELSVDVSSISIFKDVPIRVARFGLASGGKG